MIDNVRILTDKITDYANQLKQIPYSCVEELYDLVEKHYNEIPETNKQWLIKYLITTSVKPFLRGDAVRMWYKLERIAGVSEKDIEKQKSIREKVPLPYEIPLRK